MNMRHLSNCTFLNLFHQRVLVLISLTFLIKFILKYLTDFVTIIDGIYLFPFSDISLSVYRGTTEFCMLNLTSVTYLNLLMSSNNFLVKCFWFSVSNITSLTNNDSFTSFTTWMHVISFACLIALVRTCSTMLNKNAENEYPCLLPDVTG